MIVVLGLALPGVALGQEGEGGSVGSFPQPANTIDLLSPIGPLLSGRPWLMTQGMDPGFARMPGEDPLTGLDWRSLGGSGGPTPDSPRTQSPGAAALVPFRNPGPAFSGNVLITRDFGQSPYQTEPSLSVDPNDPEHLVLGTIDYGFPTNSSYVSLDGGETWDGPFHAPYLLEDAGSGGDPVVDFDRAGNVYMTGISIGEEDFTVGPVGITTEVSSIAVSRSDDGGYSWPATISSARSGVSTSGLTPDRFGRLRGNLSIGFLDKPWIAIGPDPEDATRDILYVTYTDFNTEYQVLWIGEVPTLIPTATTSTIRLVRSEDGGQTWSDPVAVSPTVNQSYGEVPAPSETPGIFGTKRTVQGSQPVVGPDGAVTVAWLDTTDDEAMKGIGEIDIASSTDKGATFSTPVTASAFNELGFRPRTSFFRYWGSEFPQLAIGPKGELYIAYCAKPSEPARDDSDVYLVSSTDDGQTWGRPTRLNDDDGAALQFFPSIDVDPNGSVHAMWADMRDDPSETRYQIYYTRSDDQGETWGFVDDVLGIRSGDTRVSDFGSNPNRGFPFGLFLGDYFSLKATADEVYMVWPDTRLGEYGAPNQKIAFARRAAITKPQLFLSPPSGPGGQQVTLQGFGFQPDLNVFVQLGDSTIAYGRTDRDGQFTNVLYMPVTGEGAQTLTAADESGNVASTSYFTDFGFGSIKQLLDELKQQNGGGASPTPSPAP